MTVKKCDRCGKIFTTHAIEKVDSLPNGKAYCYTQTHPSRKLATYMFDDAGCVKLKDGRDMYVDLCDECVIDLERWLHGDDKEKEEQPRQKPVTDLDPDSLMMEPELLWADTKETKNGKEKER